MGDIIGSNRFGREFANIHPLTRQRMRKPKKILTSEEI